MDLNDLPRVRLARLPTPMERLDRLSAHLGGPAIYVKRDDETGLGLGGNKLRKLEFLLGEALAQGADTVLTVGALQSNHCRQTAAACAKLGLDCELILRRSSHASEAYLGNGNVLLDTLFGARLNVLEATASREEAMAQRAAALRLAGRRPYCIPVGGSCTTGDLGYAAGAQEVLTQADERALNFAALFVATGSGGTQAGLVAGVHVLGAALPVIGVAVEATRTAQEELVFHQAEETARHLGAVAPLPRERVTVLDDYAGPGYARPTSSMQEALQMFARLEGLVLDPVYTGKAAAGLIDQVRGGRFRREEAVLFIHTGGTPGVFAYPEQLGPAT